MRWIRRDQQHRRSNFRQLNRQRTTIYQKGLNRGTNGYLSITWWLFCQHLLFLQQKSISKIFHQEYFAEKDPYPLFKFRKKLIFFLDRAKASQSANRTRPKFLLASLLIPAFRRKKSRQFLKIIKHIQRFIENDNINA